MLIRMDSTLLKGLRVLEALARSDSPRGVSDLARDLDLTRSNVHRTLQTLCEAGYVRQVEDGRRYECTLRLFELASVLVDGLDVRRLAGRHIRSLSDLTEETVHLAVLDGTEVVYLDKIDSLQPIRAYSAVGGRAPAHCVASGKALLSRSSDDVVRRVLDDLSAHTDNSITEEGALRRELRESRESGCAVNRGEWRSAVGGIAAPVIGAGGAPEAAVGVSGPLHRILGREEFLRRSVLDTARRISLEIGCSTYPDATPGEPTKGPE